jgi:tetratricopeptide (TPR) repeat protein
MSEKETTAEPSFKLNFASLILLLVILIPVGYTIYANLQKPTPPPVINPAAQVSAPTPAASPADEINQALQAANAKPDYAAFINLGLAYYKAAMYRESITAWEKALEYNPQGELAFNNIAAAYGNMNDYDAEIKICERALAINPNLDIAKRNLEWAKSMKNKK